MPATKKAIEQPAIFIRQKWKKQLLTLKLNSFFSLPNEDQARRLREMISRLKKTNCSLNNKNFTVVRKKQKLKIGQKVKPPVFQCWRIK